MTTAVETIDPIGLATACLAAARSAAAEGDDQTAAYYLATCRGAVDAVTEQVERLRLNLRTVEGEMLRRGQPKRLVGADAERAAG